MLLFNNESLILGKKTLQLRKDNKLKYGNIELPHDVDETKGYHMKCYKKLTALSEPQREKLNKIIEGPTTLVSGKKILTACSVLENYHQYHIVLLKFLRKPACSVID